MVCTMIHVQCIYVTACTCMCLKLNLLVYRYLIAHTTVLTVATANTATSKTKTATNMPAVCNWDSDSGVAYGVGITLSTVGVSSANCCVLLDKQEETRKPAHGGC